MKKMRKREGEGEGAKERKIDREEKIDIVTDRHDKYVY